MMLSRAAAKRWLAVLALVVAAGTTAAQPPPASLFVVHFETGPSWNKSLAPSDQPGFREHSANLNRLRKEGTIVFGARYGDLGMIFLKAEALDAAQALIEADPGVQSGIVSYRIAPLRVFYPWQP
jgi:uncharacterized protein YciI